ncbi:MAG: phosphonoacetaldehyde reductase [Nanoarchaeota archaeon]|nr:phosphonoacetaldehyde reductase [Nanoarchaeota archaeon]
MVQQQAYFGLGVLQKIKEVLDKENPSRIFLVCGKSSYLASSAQKELTPLLERYAVIPFNDFSPNPKIEDIKKGIFCHNQEPADITLAIGGGSTIDMAKAITLLAEQTGEPETYICKKDQSIIPKSRKIIAVPTTAGAGSEATHFAVVYVNKTKYSLAHPSLLPDYALVDPQLTFSLSPYATASTGMDALAQAIESYWCINTTEESKNYARESITLVLKYLASAVHMPTPDARIAMAKAAHLAGKAINISKTTLCHAISYSLTSYFGIPHGHAVALSLGETFTYNAALSESECADSRGIDYVRSTLEELCDLFQMHDPKEVKESLAVLMRTIGLEERLHYLGITRGDLPLIMSKVDLERGQNNPRKVSSDSLLELLKNIF